MIFEKGDKYFFEKWKERSGGRGGIAIGDRRQIKKIIAMHHANNDCTMPKTSTTHQERYATQHHRKHSPPTKLNHGSADNVIE